MLSEAAKKLDIKTTIYSDDINAPAQNFCDEFIFGEYDDKTKILKECDPHLDLMLFPEDDIEVYYFRLSPIL